MESITQNTKQNVNKFRKLGNCRCARSYGHLYEVLKLQSDIQRSRFPTIPSFSTNMVVRCTFWYSTLGDSSLMFSEQKADALFDASWCFRIESWWSAAVDQVSVVISFCGVLYSYITVGIHFWLCRSYIVPVHFSKSRAFIPLPSIRSCRVLKPYSRFTGTYQNWRPQTMCAIHHTARTLVDLYSCNSFFSRWMTRKHCKWHNNSQPRASPSSTGLPRRIRSVTVNSEGAKAIVSRHGYRYISVFFSDV